MKEYSVTDPESVRMRLDRWLTEQVAGRARNQIQHDLEAGLVRVGGEVRPARYRMTLGDHVEYDEPEVVDGRLRPEAIPLNIIFEDENMIVIDKPAGMVVHPAPGHASGTVANALLAHCGPMLEGVGGEARWGIVHRLDNLTSGLMMAAKTQPAYEALVAALAARRVGRRYIGLVAGFFMQNTGSIDKPIGRRSNDRKMMGIVADGREARTDWRVIYQDEGLALVGLALHTGRTHQIRVHLQSIGRPVLGDAEYGWTKPRTVQLFAQRHRAPLAAVWPTRQMLHAARLSLEHPIETGRQMSFQSALPDDMRRVIEAIWNQAPWTAPLENWFAGNLDPVPEPDETV